MAGCDVFKSFLIPRWTEAFTCVDVDTSLSASNRLNMLCEYLVGECCSVDGLGSSLLLSS